MRQDTRLDSKELEQLIDMSKLFKTEAYSSRTRYMEEFYPNVKNILNQLNTTATLTNAERKYNSKLHTEAISQYLSQKDIEFYKRYNPALVRKLKEQNKLKIWMDVFNKQPSHTSSVEIKQKIDEICRKIIFLKRSVPPYFTYLVVQLLENSKTPVLCREVTIYYNVETVGLYVKV